MIKSNEKPTMCLPFFHVPIQHFYSVRIQFVCFNDKIIFNRNGEDWAKLRRPTQELMLRPAAVSAYVSILARVADDFVELYKHGGFVDDLRQQLLRYVTESKLYKTNTLYHIFSI